MLLVTLALRLQRLAPERAQVPPDYEQNIQDAVLQFGQDAPLARTGTLNLVSGTASYALPSDFQALIDLPALYLRSGAINGAQGLIPASAGWEETWDVGGGQITFYPTPAYTLARTYRYAAGYELVSGDYPRLTEADARLVLLYGQYLVLSQQATPQAGGITEYAIGDESVKRGDQAASLMKQAQGFLSEYQRGVRKRQGYGMTAQYSAAEGSGVLWP